MALQLVQKRLDGTWGHPDGHPGGFRVSNHEMLFTQWPEILAKLGPGPWVNLYATVAHHLLEEGKGYSKPQRTGQTYQYQNELPFDIDHCDTTRAFEYLACVAHALRVEPRSLTLICTGNGLHIYAHLRTPIRSLKFLGELKPAYNEMCQIIEREIALRGLPLDKAIGGKVDPVIIDAARILRVPGTINRKEGKPDTECVLLQHSSESHELNLHALSGLDKIQKENVSPEQIRRQFPKPDLAEIVKECRFIGWAMTKPEEVHEPQNFALISLMAAQVPASKVSYQGKEMTAKEMAEAVWNSSINSVSSQSQAFDRKWEDGSRYGAQKCSTISGHWIGGCESCPHHGRIPTPLALKSPDFVGSEALGYWVLNAKGNPLHPHYGDLTRVYGNEKSFVVTDSGRMFNFEQSRYVETTQLTVKAWMEKKVTPDDPIRETHRNEFLKKMNVAGAISKDAEESLFSTSTVGKLNCRNGVLDIVRGELLPHAPQHGFQYVLPYDYQPDQASELFLDWLELVTQSRTELMEAILDMMAYCLWPTYDDHVFFFLVGEGGNGKGTLTHILHAMLGAENYSSVSMQQLGGNRFAPANLEGKLANLSEESSGYEMSYEELNVLKNLSAGGDMNVERKGVQGFSFRNKAKLVFSANKPPRFKETGYAIKRRMVVLPFDFTIQNFDQNVEARLIGDVPLIVSMLVRRIQENTRRNAGRFKVSRGGAPAAEAQRTLLLAGNSVIEWAKENVESSTEIEPEAYIVIGDAYQRYKAWCEENNYRAYNKGLFSHMMSTSVVTSAVDVLDNRVRVDQKQVRVFKRTQWKEDE